jgi:hypothetical protein
MSRAFHNAQSVSSIMLRDNSPQFLNHAYLASLVPSNVSCGLRSSGMFGCLPAFRYNLSVTLSKFRQSKTGHIGCPETSVNNYQHTLRNNLEDRRPHPHDGGNQVPHNAGCLSAVDFWQIRVASFIFLPLFITCVN